jgi:signal transduction histidine kinase
MSCSTATLHYEALAIARVLIKCNQLAARAADEREALQSACELLVASGPFRGASIGCNQAGRHDGARAARCFALAADAQPLGQLTLSAAAPDAFAPDIVALIADWCEGFAQLVMAARRRAAHECGNARRSCDGVLEQLRRTEAALWRSDALLAETQRLSRTGSFNWTTSTGAMTWSEESLRIFGYAATWRMPTLADLLARVAREDQPRAQAAFERAIRHGEDFDCQLCLSLPDGARKHVRVVAQAADSGELRGTVMDVSVVEELREALQLRDQAMAILGHDLRNPVAAVLGLIRMTRLHQALSPLVTDKLGRIERVALRMNELIDVLLDFTCMRVSGPPRILPTETNLADVCSRVVEELSAGHPQRTISLSVDGDTRGHCDAGRIAQVVSNLTANALVHGDPGAPVRVLVERRCDGLAIKVHNFGDAIAREQISSLFEPFRRGSSCAGRTPRGLGLGLHIVKQIVSAHGGSISVESSAHEGTTFSVALPCPEALSREHAKVA